MALVAVLAHYEAIIVNFTHDSGRHLMRLLVTGGSGFIGTNLIAEAMARGWTPLNLDINPPQDATQQAWWRAVDLLDESAMAAAFAEFLPDAIIHLAARTDCDENTTMEAGYRANTQGTLNVLSAIRATPSIHRVIVASTQFVFNKGPILPGGDDDYHPRTVYGQSKVLTEQYTRKASLKAAWSIVRPTTIWGPWDLKYRSHFYSVIRRGLYVHPGHQPCMRSYGYVGNVVWQLLGLLQADERKVSGRVFYVGDPMVNVRDWVNAFSRQLHGRDVLVIPGWGLRPLAWLGDTWRAFTGRRFVLDSVRLRSMTQDYLAPMDAIFELLGDPPYDLDRGITQTLSWLQTSSAQVAKARSDCP